MSKVLVVYASDYGNTKKMAEAAAQGVRSVEGAEAILKSAEEVQAEDFLAADGVLLGSPVHMGSMDWRMKKLIDSVCGHLWMKDRLVGKVGGVFASGGGYGNAGGGCELTMLSMMSNLAELGLVLIPLPKNTPGYPQAGLQWGPYARSAGEKMEQTGVTPAQMQAAEAHGRHIARAAQALRGKNIFV